MVLSRLALAVALVAGSTFGASAATRIGPDEGGQIGPYLAKYRALQVSGDFVIVDGVCASACTMILGILPRSRLCVTHNAVFQFHSAWDAGPKSIPAVSSSGNRLLWRSYPRDLRNWILRHGGLGPRGDSTERTRFVEDVQRLSVAA